MAGFSAFSSALENTARKVLNGPKMIRNLATKDNYRTLYYMLRGKKMSEVLGGGSDIRKKVKFATSSTAGFYDVGTEEHSPTSSQDGSWLIAYWVAHMGHETWKEEELLINAGGLSMNSTIEETYVNELFSKMQSLQTAIYNTIADSYWRLPNNAEMDFQGCLYPNSIPYYLNDGPNGLFGSGSGYAAANKISTIHGVSPATNPQYKFKTATYGSSAQQGFVSTDLKNVIYCLSLLMRQTDFQAPPMHDEYFDAEDETAIDRSGGVILTSSVGVAQVERLYVQSQNRWPDYMDPAGNPRYKTVQIVNEAILDTAALYSNNATWASATAPVSESAAALPGPRYYGVNGRDFRSMFHRARYFEFLEPFRQNHTTWSQGVQTMMTNFCENRRGSFFLAPGYTHSNVYA